MSDINPLNEDGTPKTEKQLKKEQEKAAKLAKFNAKKAAQAIASDKPSTGKPKEKKKVEEKKVVTYDINTPSGEKKDISCDLPAQYSVPYVEASWYTWWTKKGFFKPEYQHKNGDLSIPNPKGQFVMVIPPPNVTGNLHLGHALTNAVEDAITRWNRMNGRTTLWVPGCDHAGIATQVVVEKKIKREEGKSRHDLGKKAFIERVWQYKEEKGNHIYEQIQKMGSSMDWDRACFTLDKGPQEAVKESFIRLYEDGVIYRANRLVNWSCTLKSAISDIEVEKKELTGRTELPVPGYAGKVEFGVLIQFAYPVQGSGERLVVATTRIETMLGDTAVAVHPEDGRYKHLHGKSVVHPITGAVLPIVTDTFVEQDFGTGAVKITPAHDPNDFEVGKRHSLPFVNIFTDDGCIVEGYGEFSGMPRFECRVKIQEKLKQLGSYVDTKDNPMVVPFCSRSKDIVEPVLKPQWYVRCAEMAADAIKVVEDGELELIPSMHVKTWNHWMNEIRDWCISRQLWWGHSIPAYYVTLKGEAKSGTEDPERWIVARSEEDAKAKAALKFKVPTSDITVVQDPDVLDTWYSSALFPFAAMGWPNKTQDLELFYPGSLLETGHDILFFWVARMVFFGRKLMGKLPFKQVYLHAMVRDSHGRKMSKSLGNVLDPMDVILGVTLEELHRQLEANTNLDPTELAKAKAGQAMDYPKGIEECGTDALRFALCDYTKQGRDINLDVLRVHAYRKFCNKLWNASKFAMTHLAEPFQPLSPGDIKACVLPKKNTDGKSLDKLEEWLLSRSYIVGHFPSKTDLEVYKKVSALPLSSRNSTNIARWFRHISSFVESGNQQQSGQLNALVDVKSEDRLSELMESLPTETDMCVPDMPASCAWLLSQLGGCVAECNAGFSQFSFSQATQALHSLWQHSICDIFLELAKPHLYAKEDTKAKYWTQQVLHLALHTGLRLISPFMPFLTEELFQRLPSPPSSLPAPESICVAEYPKTEEYSMYIDETVNGHFELLSKVVSEILAAKALYGIPNKKSVELTLTSDSAETLALLETVKGDIATLAFASQVSVTDQKPSGSVPQPVGAECVAWVKLQGEIDLSSCEGKLRTKREDCQGKLEKLAKDMAKDTYAKVPEDVKSKNTQKVEDLNVEKSQLDDAVEQLAKLQL